MEINSGDTLILKNGTVVVVQPFADQSHTYENRLLRRYIGQTFSNNTIVFTLVDVLKKL